MKGRIKKYLVTVMCLVAFVLPMLQPMTVKAAETVGGANNEVVIDSITIDTTTSSTLKTINQFTLNAKNGYEIVGVLEPMMSGDDIRYYILSLKVVKNGVIGNISSTGVCDVVGYVAYYKDGEITSSQSYSDANFPSIGFKNGTAQGINITASATGLKIFTDSDSLKAYATTGDTSGILKDEIDKSWHLKNIGYSVRAEDSPTSETEGEDATYIKFTWDIDNLEEGDLLEVKTHSSLKKIGGDEISGFHDFITYAHNVSAYSGEYELSQYDATKAWFSTLENKPLIFKSYDTDTYYLRPWRNGVAGGWVKVSLKRNTPTSSPYVPNGGIEYGGFDEDGEWIVDEELTESLGGYGIDQNGNKIFPEDENLFTGTSIDNIFSHFFEFMKSLPSLFGDLPALLNQTIGFLPAWMIGAICAAILIVIILRIVGR